MKAVTNPINPAGGVVVVATSVVVVVTPGIVEVVGGLVVVVDSAGVVVTVVDDVEAVEHGGQGPPQSISSSHEPS